MLKRLLAAAAIWLTALSPLVASDAGMIHPGHVLGNNTSSERTPGDASLVSVAAQPGSGISASVAAALANATNVANGFPVLNGSGYLATAQGGLGIVPNSSAASAMANAPNAANGLAQLNSSALLARAQGGFGLVPDASTATAAGNALNGPSGLLGYGGAPAAGVAFTQSGTGAVSSTVDARLKLDYVHIKDFGAVGNGTTDDTTAFQNAVNQAQSSGGALFLDSGTYKITSAINVTACLSVLGAGNASIVSLGSTTQNGFNITTTCQAHLHDFSMTATGPQSAGAMVLVNPASGENSGTDIHDMSFSNYYTALDFEKAAGWRVNHNIFSDGVAQTAIVKNTNNADSGDSEFIGNDVQYAAAGASAIGVYQESSGGIKIVGNKFNTVNYGYQLNTASGISSSIIIIDGNSIENCVTSCIHLGTQAPTAGQWRAVQIVGNEIMALTGANAIKITASSTNTWLLGVSIVGNSILLESGTGMCGVCVDYATAVSVADNYIEDVPGGNSTGISFTSNTSLSSISHNIYRSFPAGFAIANASTTTTIDEPQGIAFANLPSAAANGSRIFLTDGAPASSPCTGTSTGSTAFRQNSAWKCF